MWFLKVDNILVCCQLHFKYQHMDYNTKTFCSAAWFGLRNEQFGDFQVCSSIDHAASEFSGVRNYSWPEHSVQQFVNSEYAQYVRSNLTAGHALSECHRCWHNESLGLASARTISNNTVTNNRGHELDRTWVHAYITKKQDHAHDHLIAADVKLTNTCNFACAMCNPADSSKVYAAWSSSQQHPVIQLHLDRNPDYLDQVRTHFVDKNNHSLLAELLATGPRHIKLLGGEPLLDQQAMSMLTQYPGADTTRLSFVTNGSVDLLKTSAALGRYQNVHYTVSLEGVGAVQDYLRRGSNWQQISNNIDQFLEHHAANINIHVTLQALNLLHLPLLLDWCHSRQLPITFGQVTDPAYLSLAAMPDQLRNQHSLDPYHNQLQGLISHVANTQHVPHLTQQLQQFFDWYDPTQAWRGIMPEWAPWIN
jgi:molybdenum cofactor biosynthesis enzyme MoaA